MPNKTRRRLLQGAGAGLLLPWRTLAQQTPGALLRAPRLALVIGNGGYRENPLKNPVNDARAIGEELERTGFEVISGIDLDRAAMAKRVRAFTDQLGRSKAIGLFFFAGHGVQLAWRNYLLPVDASIDSIEEVQRRCIDVNSVVEGMAQAANPMNLVMLDACRDNPFGRDFRIQHKGLSQLDAPPGTLLAYATSPGNVASDGEGEHGLYTEHLLREMRVPGVQIEDMFKRVRLGVRRRSNGRQIPWESTSLEDDFWFIPPRELKRLADDEAAREFRQELELWERAQAAREPGPLEDYLRRYPSGRFSELAQLRLDRVLAQLGEQKIAVVTAPENPYTKGWAAANTRYAVGDTYTYRVLDLYTKNVEREFTNTITAVTDSEVVYNNGRFVTDLLGNPRRMADGRRLSANQNYPAEFAVGKRWTSRFIVTNPKGQFDTQIDFRIAARERIRVPAGEFDTFRVEGSGTAAGSFMPFPLHVTVRHWFAPERCRLAIAREELRQAPRRVVASERYELVAFSQS
jgi:uncharacterized caspase-like protein